MTKISVPLFIFFSILSFCLGMGVFAGLTNSKIKTETKIKVKSEKYIFKDEDRISEVHNHTIWYGDTMYVRCDTTFITKK